MNTYDIIPSITDQDTYNASTKRGKSLINNITSETLSSDLSNADLDALVKQDDNTISHQLSQSSETFRKYVHRQHGSEGMGRQIVQRCLNQIGTASKKRKQYGERSEGGGERPVFGNSTYHTEFSQNTLSREERVIQQEQGQHGFGEAYALSRERFVPPQAQAQARSGNNPFGVGSSGPSTTATFTPQTQGVIPLSQYDSNFTIMTYRTIRPLGSYPETWKSCADYNGPHDNVDHETQEWLEHLSFKMSKFDYSTLCDFEADERVFRPGLSSIVGERSIIFQDFYSGRPDGVALMKQILSRAKEMRIFEDQSRAAEYGYVSQGGGGGSGGTGFDPVRDI